jgi:formamidopyrimidine-DNA glycosylase
MPELPEVETTLRYLKPYILEQAIAEFSAPPTSARQFNLPIADMQSKLVGARFTDANRIGKWMLFTLEPAKPDNAGDAEQNTSTPFHLISHLRMSGRFKVERERLDHPHLRFHLTLADGTVLNFLDQRRFGTLHYVASLNEHKGVSALGPDALSAEFTPEYLYSRLQKTRKPIYTALLDQTIVAGLGNIYVNEALHAAAVHPLLPANEITPAQAAALVSEAQRILALALKFKGTTLIDNLYQDPEGKTGDFAKMLQVYGKKKDPDVKVLRINGRSVFTKL